MNVPQVLDVLVDVSQCPELLQLFFADLPRGCGSCARRRPHRGESGPHLADSLRVALRKIFSFAGIASQVVQLLVQREHLVHRAQQIMQADFEPATWQAFWKTVVEDQPAVEVAAELGLGIDAVYKYKSRVLRRLRQELDGLLD